MVMLMKNLVHDSFAHTASIFMGMQSNLVCFPFIYTKLLIM
jgi:hypothetical protein